jgi:hypothetical protein
MARGHPRGAPVVRCGPAGEGVHRRAGRSASAAGRRALPRRARRGRWMGRRRPGHAPARPPHRATRRARRRPEAGPARALVTGRSSAHRARHPRCRGHRARYDSRRSRRALPLAVLGRRGGRSSRRRRDRGAARRPTRDGPGRVGCCRPVPERARRTALRSILRVAQRRAEALPHPRMGDRRHGRAIARGAAARRPLSARRRGRAVQRVPPPGHDCRQLVVTARPGP